MKISLIKQLSFYTLILVLFSACGTSKTSKESPKKILNSAEAQKAPYVILISLDGFRWDYVDRLHPPHLENFVKTGSKVESLIPCFPSKTFPNHYSIATGMYPDKHGIIGNTFYNYLKDAEYSVGNRDRVEDGTYYKGNPIWVLADQKGMVSASYFFVGSEAEINGSRPSYFYRYESKVPNQDRVDQAIKWLGLPPEKRPHIITLYFSDMDNAGHDYGPLDDEKLLEKLLPLDSVLGSLFDTISKSKLDINVIIVSDHGMKEVQIDDYIELDALENDLIYRTINNGAIVSIHPYDTANTEAILQSLKQRENHFKVYRTENTPGFEYRPDSRDWGSIQIVPDYGYYFASKERIRYLRQHDKLITGQHGYDPKYREMHGIFYANGPAFKSGYSRSSTQNINIYPLICKILGLSVSDEVDGKLDHVKDILK